MFPKANILIVDDQRELREFIRFVLRDKYCVAVASAAEDAYKCLAECPVNAVLLDYNMPEIDGITALTEIKKRYHDMEVIMMSGYAPPDAMRKAFRLGAFAFLMKPFEVDELINTIDAALRRNAS
ncbi:MAG: response regulator [Nitrospirae bacterium]|nr:response regulator [Nitrospirota bacterium]